MNFHLPCGQCIGCRLQKAREWSIRCTHEAEMHDHNSFITLTYNEEHYPTDPFGSLDLDHWKKFRKRLRYHCGPFRFISVGEYGDALLRPHYHALIFGLDFQWDAEPVEGHSMKEFWTSPELEKIWGKGYVTVAPLNAATVGYVCKYAIKKQTGDHVSTERTDPETGECWEVAPEFVTHSRRPGIGSTWIQKWGKTDVFPGDDVVINGTKMRPPSYYDQFLDDQALEAVKKKRKDAMQERSEQFTEELLRKREEWLQGRLQRRAQEKKLGL